METVQRASYLHLGTFSHFQPLFPDHPVAGETRVEEIR